MTKKKNKDACTTYYLFDDRPLCLHRIFAHGWVRAITREQTPTGIKFYIWQHYNKKYKYQTGGRSQLKSRDQIELGIELAKKYNVERIRL